MAVSTNSIIHYTDKLDSLLGIISEGFKVRFCSELMQSPKWRIDALVPMISFCDIPFSSFQDHVQAYGSYGIGLSKDWAYNNGINPVLYMSKGSSINNTYLNYMAETISKKTKADLKAMDFMKKLIVYAKNYQADLERKNVKIPDYRFYNEREWRFILQVHNRKSIQPVFSPKPGDKETLNESISDIRIDFDVKHITYIIVKTIDEIEVAINSIRSSYNDRCTNKQLDILLTKIISVEQIRNDF
jgi:hypothetical protein